MRTNRKEKTTLYTYEQVIEKIESSRRFGRLPGVEVTRKILKQLGQPQQGMRFVHVAGTNGKGSVCAFLTNILCEAGVRVGTFTSPHLVNFEERITVNQEMIAKEDVTRLGNDLLSFDFGVEATMFDYCLLMAVLYFKEQNCEIAVIETGLGGRLDSTNALGTPEVSVITRIGYDHTAILGDTLEQIAAEKAGIIKEGSVFVMETQEKEVTDLLLRAAKTAKVSSIRQVTADEIEEIRGWNLKMAGRYQWENAAAAKLVAEALLGEGNQPAVIRRGVEGAVWNGRMQIVSWEPFLMVDGAHNGNGVSALSESLEMMYPGEKFHFLMGVMADKDYLNMMKQMNPIAVKYTTFTPDSERAMQAEQLAQKLQEMGIKADYAQDLPSVLRALPRDCKTIAFGSLYFIGEILAYYSR